MNKAELVSAMAQHSGLKKNASESALNAFLEAVQETLKANEKVALVGFGTFERRARKERKVMNPRTKQAMTVPATTVPAFKVGKGLKECVQSTGQTQEKKQKAGGAAPTKKAPKK